MVLGEKMMQRGEQLKTSAGGIMTETTSGLTRRGRGAGLQEVGGRGAGGSG